MKFCLCCEINNISGKAKFCSNKCQKTFERNEFIKDWKINPVNKMSSHIKKYLLEKFEFKCSRCGWREINPFSNTLPLEVEHIDGNSENNVETNLTILCPNCHSLTKTYKGANRGNGRFSRRQRYVQKKSY